ncbi:dihydrolipoamide acetyltransferase family protein [Actinacidiphila acididurans]|uniref:Dihydrolipoamide acetyltransferase component of pyruvate dehydrogenase complex n=1 Tax=Actinacidiphila acididurans TaxID=2784346 RepID=A0ABS2TS29_9ACTN|nr:dihydrolipoamide acetyltransferase family protein [Actinacidiphila acididurans]MBM9505887.1 2-oxo acid dehydrogenase subunit E2 [Actinacidiphila acididurans]
MAVVKEFTLPDLGEGLTEAEIVRWLVEIGEVVAVDQPVVEVETAKAVVEVPCPYGGVVTARFGEEGETLAVGRPLVTVAVGPGADEGSDLGAGDPGMRGAAGGTGPGGAPAGGGAGTGDGGSGEGSGNVLVGYGTAAATGRRRNRVRAVAAATAAAGEAVDAPANGHAAVGGASGGTGGGAAPGPVTADPGRAGGRAAALGTISGAGPAPAAGSGVAAPTSDAHRMNGGTPTARAGAVGQEGPVAVISPLVRRIAREHGLDLRTLRGTGPDGLILRADVERAVAEAAAPAPVAAAESAPAPSEVLGAVGEVAGAERIPLRGIRGAVADKLTRSRREIPDATCWVDADATELLAVRAAMNAAAQTAGAGRPDGGTDGRISVLALLGRIAVAALSRFPDLNATVDAERGEIVRLPAVHLGFAAQTDRGLVVPVVKDAQARTTAELSAEIARLTRAARDGSLTPGDLTGGTFTLNNYGVFGVDGSTPIINHPEAAMLGVGRITPKPWVHRDELAIRQVVQLSFTFDHRVCDGGTAGGFLRFVADCVENPAVLLASV